MIERDKVVARFKDGRVLKGHVNDFDQNAVEVILTDPKNGKELQISMDELKALFFVHSLEGDQTYRERKVFGISKNIGHKIYIRFHDGESMLGFVKGDVPWEKGFYRSKPGDRSSGFFMAPVDGDSNNMKIFVVASAIRDISVIVA
jgi:small nuclear ribonucleoprotein (snRNP)-like protein